MILVAIITRKLKSGKSYADFRKAWFHTVGFGRPSKLYTMINAFDSRKITVIGFIDVGDVTDEQLLDGLRIDVKERLEHSLDEVIEPEIDRAFGILVAEDDFSSAGELGYLAPTIAGKETNLEDLYTKLQMFSQAITRASNERDQAKK